MLHFACSTGYLPLTLILSLPPSRRAKAPLRRDGGREREQQASDWWFSLWSLGKLRHGCDREAVDHSPSPQGRGPGWN